MLGGHGRRQEAQMHSFSPLLRAALHASYRLRGGCKCATCIPDLNTWLPGLGDERKAGLTPATRPDSCSGDDELCLQPQQGAHKASVATFNTATG
jgi:hypothetical protein